MKKIFTLAAAFMATALSFQAAADSWVVTTSAEFTTALSSLSRTQGAMDTIFVNPESPDVVISSGTYKTVPTAGKFWIIGVPTDFRPIVQMRFDAEAGTEPGSDLSMIFENLNIQYTSGNTATSGQIFYFNGKYVDMDTLAFRNCDITNYPRTLYRSVPPKDENGAYMEGGSINYFEMVNCRVYDANVTSGNRWPCVYFGQVPIEVVFRNNTFYDMPYLKAIFTMGYITDETGRADGTVTFENNTVMVASDGYAAIDVANYMGMASTFNVNNNMFLYPDWTDDLNMAAATQPTILKCSYGMIYGANNVIEGYKNWSAGNNKDEETGEYTWLSADTTNNYTMATAELAWDDFYDRYNKDFSLLKSYKVYTAGADIEGNPTYIGAEEWYLDEFPVKAAVNVSIAGGSTTASVTVQPEKTIYFVGDEITVSIDLHDGLNTFMGWSDGVSEMNRTITLTGDLNLTANVVSADYEMLWDFCQLKDGSSKNLTLPFAANHAANAENVGQLGIMTVEHSADGVTYADTTFAQTRNNKAYIYNGSAEPVLFMAGLLRTRLDSVVVEQEEAAAGYNEELTKACCANPDYYYIKFSTKGMTGVKVSAVLLAEARMHKTTKMEYSLDNASWNTLTTITIDSVGDAWRDAIATLPAAAENQDVVYVRWIGDVDSPIVGPGMAGTDKDANGWPVSRKYYTYQFIGNIKVTAETGGSAIEEAQAEVTALVVAQNGDQVTVSNADAATVELYAANGSLLASEAVINGSATITLPAHGVYYIKAGKEAKSVVY